MLSRLLLFHAFCILCMKCLHLWFVMRCSVLVAVSVLVSEKRLFVMHVSESSVQRIVRRSRHSFFQASSNLYFHFSFVIWRFIAWKLFQKLFYSCLLVGLLTSRAHSNSCNTDDLWLSRLVSFLDLLPLCCIHQQPASLKSLHRSRNGSSRPFYAQCMKCLNRFFVTKFAFFFMQNYGLDFGGLILFSTSTILRVCVLGGCSFQIFRGKFYDVWFEIKISV